MADHRPRALRNAASGRNIEFETTKSTNDTKNRIARVKSSSFTDPLRAPRVLRGFDLKMLARKTRYCAFAVQRRVFIVLKEGVHSTPYYAVHSNLVTGVSDVWSVWSPAFTRS